MGHGSLECFTTALMFGVCYSGRALSLLCFYDFRSIAKASVERANRACMGTDAAFVLVLG